jgi:hypothetical protein
MSQYSNADFWNRNKTRGTIMAGALAAVVIAYRIRHARQERRRADLPGKVSEVAREVVGDDPLEAGREFLVAKVIPEFKPAILGILKEFEEMVEDGFTRAEQVIKKL